RFFFFLFLLLFLLLFLAHCFLRLRLDLAKVVRRRLFVQRALHEMLERGRSQLGERIGRHHRPIGIDRRWRRGERRRLDGRDARQRRRERIRRRRFRRNRNRLGTRPGILRNRRRRRSHLLAHHQRRANEQLLVHRVRALVHREQLDPHAVLAAGSFAVGV